MIKKHFITSGWSAIFAAFLILVSLYITVLFAIVSMWWAFFVSLVFSYFFYASHLNYFLRIISFKNGILKVTPSLTFFDKMQHRVKLHISTIVAAKFEYMQGNTKGKKIDRAWDIPCLTCILNDGSEQKVALLGFSKDQIIQIEKTLIKSNPNIIVSNILIKEKKQSLENSILDVEYPLNYLTCTLERIGDSNYIRLNDVLIPIPLQKAKTILDNNGKNFDIIIGIPPTEIKIGENNNSIDTCIQSFVETINEFHIRVTTIDGTAIVLKTQKNIIPKNSILNIKNGKILRIYFEEECLSYYDIKTGKKIL